MLGILDYYLGSDINDEKRKLIRIMLLEKQFILTLEDSKIGLISDTHIGSKLDNLEYLRQSYSFFKSMGIKEVVHLGDLLDAYNERPDLTVSELIEVCSSQIQRFHDFYPKDIKTNILLGNHDEKISKLNIDLPSELSSDNINVLGYGGSYINCSDYKLYLEHKVSISRLVPPKYNYDLILQGHSHFFKYIENRKKLKIASCSDLQPNSYSLDYYAPGFATIATTNGLVIDGYNFIEDETVHTLTLKIKD